VRRFNDRPNTRVEFQAEAFDERDHPRSGFYWWCQTYQSSSGWTGKCFMKAEPNVGTNFDTGYQYQSPKLLYYVPFPQSAPTRYYIWIRGRGCSGQDDSVHVGLDDLPVSTAERMTGWADCSWQWKSVRTNGERPYFDVSWSTTNSAFHGVPLWMGKDGMRVDKIILTSERCLYPPGASPPPGC